MERGAQGELDALQAEFPVGKEGSGDRYEKYMDKGLALGQDPVGVAGDGKGEEVKPDINPDPTCCYFSAARFRCCLVADAGKARCR